MDVVIDTSVAVSMLFEDEVSPLAEGLETILLDGGKLVAPSLILWECTNALRSAVLSKRMTTTKAKSLLNKFCALPLEIAEPPTFQELPDLLCTAVKHQLTSYDAAYLQLALSRKIPLASNDKQLNAAAKKARVDLLKPATR